MKLLLTTAAALAIAGAASNAIQAKPPAEAAIEECPWPAPRKTKPVPPSSQRYVPNRATDEAYLGIWHASVPDILKHHYPNALGSGGAMITKVEGPAHKAGIQVGDVIVMIDNKDVVDGKKVGEFVGSLQPGEVLSVDFFRAGKIHRVSVVLGKKPEKYRIENDQRVFTARAHEVQLVGNGFGYTLCAGWVDAATGIPQSLRLEGSRMELIDQLRQQIMPVTVRRDAERQLNAEPMWMPPVSPMFEPVPRLDLPMWERTYEVTRPYFYRDFNRRWEERYP